MAGFSGLVGPFFYVGYRSSDAVCHHGWVSSVVGVSLRVCCRVHTHHAASRRSRFLAGLGTSVSNSSSIISTDDCEWLGVLGVGCFSYFRDDSVFGVLGLLAVADVGSDGAFAVGSVVEVSAVGAVRGCECLHRCFLAAAILSGVKALAAWWRLPVCGLMRCVPSSRDCVGF